MAVPRVEGDALQYLKDELEARVADLLEGQEDRQTLQTAHC